jgi:Secretion system C-terminal sorting domain
MKYFFERNLSKYKKIGGLWLPITFLLITQHGIAQQSIKLPFFDDFSSAKNALPVASLWQQNGGVYINNSLANTQPTINIATFDGRDAKGVPYNVINKLSNGISDSLISKPIDLLTKSKYYLANQNTTTTFSATDDLTLSFYWLAKGLGELPDFEDSLNVEFLDKQGNWKFQKSIRVQNLAGKPISKEFTKESILIKDPSFFHSKFQFRFISVGRQSGPFDNWHIDYIKLDTKANLSSNQGNDFAIKSGLPRLFKYYSAMPMRQFLINPNKEIADTIKVNIINLSKTVRNLSGELRFSVLDSTGNAIQKTGTLLSNLYDVNESRIESVKLAPLKLSGKKAILKYQFDFDSNDDTLSVIYKANNRVEAKAVLDDYFAYDDGTAEYAAEVEKRLGKVAVQFILRKSDNIKSVLMNFSRFYRDATGENFLLQILDSKKGKPNNVLAQQGFKVQYPSDVNGLVEYVLKEPVVVTDTFYVAWTKIGVDDIPVGIDKNTPDFADKIFLNIGSEWLKNTDLKGAFLVRPVVGVEGYSKANVLASEEPKETFIVMPNPTTGFIKWQGEDVQRAEVFDISGRLMQTKIFEKTDEQQLDLQNLNNGQYLIRFFGKENEIKVKRVLVLK